jgi:hypothetical protein
MHYKNIKALKASEYFHVIECGWYDFLVQSPVQPLLTPVVMCMSD